MKRLFLFTAIAFLGGCANMTEYYKSVDSANDKNIEVAKAVAEAEKARYNALARIAESGDSTAKVAATMALALGQSSSGQKQTVIVPQAPANEALQWASILVPSVTQLGFAWFNKQVQINSSNNNRSVAEAQIGKDVQLGLGAQQTYLGFAKEINDPTVVTNTTESVVVVKPEVVNPEVVTPVVVQPTVITVPSGSVVVGP